MGSGFRKKNQIDMGSYLPNKKEQIAFAWCIENGIYISPKPATTSTWYLIIEINKNSNVSPTAYKKVEVWKQLYKYYIYYYDKYSNTKLA